MLANPCLGQRLRQPPGAPATEWRWDDFCKLDLSHQLRLIYVWNPDTPMVTIVAIGPHLAQGQLDNVYDALAEMFDLPLDEGHAQLPTEPCCGEVDPTGRTVSVDASEFLPVLPPVAAAASTWSAPLVDERRTPGVARAVRAPPRTSRARSGSAALHVPPLPTRAGWE